MEEESGLRKLKNEYKVLQEKYSLPDFDVLNQDFYIEKAADSETDYVLREIRKFISEKFGNYLRFLEMIVNPANAPVFVFSIVKAMKSEDRKKIGKVYEDLSKKELELIELDLLYSEKAEADFIKNSYNFWNNNKRVILDIIKRVRESPEVKSSSNGSNYFG